MKKLAICLAALCLGACANGLVPDDSIDNAQLAEIQRSQVEYDACLHGAARRLDDGKSGVSEVAVGVMGACQNQWSVTLSMQTKAMDQLSRELFRDRMKAQEQQNATAVVLEERQARRK